MFALAPFSFKKKKNGDMVSVSLLQYYKQVVKEKRYAARVLQKQQGDTVHASPIKF